MLQNLLILAALAPQNIITVDDDGPADHSTVTTAVAFAQPGDIISIAPGDYESTIFITKRVSLIGQDPINLPTLGTVTVDSASSINLRRLEMDRLVLKDLTGMSRLEECRIVSSFQPTNPRLSVNEVDQLLVRSCDIFAEGDWNGDGGIGADIVGDSRVHIVDCELRGGDADYSDFFEWAGWGGDALRASDTSHVTVVGSTLQGGGGETYPGAPFGGSGPDPGLGGDAIEFRDQAYVDIRGHARDVLSGGYQEYADPSQGVNGMAVKKQFLLTQGSADHGGATLTGASDGQSVDPRPYLELTNEGNPGGTARAATFGASGEAGILAMSSGSALIDLPAYGPTALWLDPSLIFDQQVLTLNGFGTPAIVTYDIPNVANLVGAKLQLQAVQVKADGSIQLTNAASILVTP